MKNKKKFEIDLQLFKGGGSSTTIVDNSYKPTPAELALQDLSLDYAKTVAPEAKDLNSTAKKILAASLFAAMLEGEKKQQEKEEILKQTEE